VRTAIASSSLMSFLCRIRQMTPKPVRIFALLPPLGNN
jgi:hypothetical protein